VTKVQRIAAADLVGNLEVAAMLGWDVKRVTSYASRGRLPEPVAWPACGRLWTRPQIEAWAGEHGIEVHQLPPADPNAPRGRSRHVSD
jgi:hypothetical protein